MISIIDLIRESFPKDFGDLPLYVVMPRDVQGALGSLAGVHGYTCASLDLQLRGHLPWLGRGPCVVINDQAVTEDFGIAGSQAGIAGVMVHECAHILTEGWLANYRAPEQPDPVYVAFTKIVAANLMERPTADCGMQYVKYDFAKHGPNFIRIAMHLRHRLEKMGMYIPVNRVFDHEHYHSGLSYSFAIGDELDTMIDATAKEILDAPLPWRLAEQYSQDLQRFEVFLTQSQKEKVTMSASILEKIVSKLSGKKKAKQLSALQQYQAIVRDIADNKEPKADDIDIVLDGAGKSVENLQGDVQRILHRRQLQVVVQRAVGVSAEKSQLEQQHAAARDMFVAAEKTWQETAWAINTRVADLDESQRQARSAKAELEGDCPDENTAAELIQLEHERRELRNRQAKLQQQKRERSEELHKSIVAELARPVIVPGTWIRENPAPADPHEVTRRLGPALQSGLREIESDLADLDKSLLALDAKETAVKSKMVMV